MFHAPGVMLTCQMTGLALTGEGEIINSNRNEDNEDIIAILRNIPETRNLG